MRFCNKVDFQTVEGNPFYNFENIALLSLRYSADFGRSRLFPFTVYAVLEVIAPITSVTLNSCCSVLRNN